MSTGPSACFCRMQYVAPKIFMREALKGALNKSRYSYGSVYVDRLIKPGSNADHTPVPM